MLYNLPLSSFPKHSCDWDHNLPCVSWEVVGGGAQVFCASEFRTELRAAGGGIESPPEKINNALVCKWPALTPRLSRRLELPRPPDRSRQVVSERNTFPQMTSWCRTARHRASRGWLPPQRPNTQSKAKITSWHFFFLFYRAIVSLRTFCLCRRVWLRLRLIRSLIRPLCVHKEGSFNLELLVFRRHDSMTLIPQSGNAQT